MCINPEKIFILIHVVVHIQFRIFQTEKLQIL